MKARTEIHNTRIIRVRNILLKGIGKDVKRFLPVAVDLNRYMLRLIDGDRNGILMHFRNNAKGGRQNL